MEALIMIFSMRKLVSKLLRNWEIKVCVCADSSDLQLVDVKIFNKFITSKVSRKDVGTENLHFFIELRMDLPQNTLLTF